MDFDVFNSFNDDLSPSEAADVKFEIESHIQDDVTALLLDQVHLPYRKLSEFLPIDSTQTFSQT